MYTNGVWDPRKVLSLYPRSLTFTCVGAAVTKGRSRCRVKIDVIACAEADTLLDEISKDLPTGKRSLEQLRRLAQFLLCQDWHHYQADEKVREWSMRITESMQQFQEQNEMRTQCQLLLQEKEDLTDSLQKHQRDLAVQTQKTTEALKKVNNLKSRSTTLGAQLSSLQAKHAALEDKCEILIQEKTQLDKTDIALSERLSEVEERAKETELDLREKISTAEKRAKETETELREKLSKAYEEVNQKEIELLQNVSIAAEGNRRSEAELRNRIDTAEEEIKMMEMKLKKLLTAEHAAKEREENLRKKLFEASQEAQRREAEIREKTEAEGKAKEKVATLCAELVVAREGVEKVEVELRKKIAGEEAAKNIARDLSERISKAEADVNAREMEFQQLRQRLAESERALEKSLKKKARRFCGFGF